MKGLSRIGRGAVAGVAVLGVGLALAVPPASAAWQTSASAPAFALSAATLAAPSTTCASMPAVGSTPAYARISWPAVAEATGYRVTIGNTANSSTAELAANQTGTTFDVTGSLLLTLLGSVLGSLLTGGTAFITVEARVQQWQSVPSNRQSVVLSSVVGGLLGGIKCQGT